MTASNQPAIFPQLNQWRQVQRSYAAQPLEFCPDFPRIAARHEAWWRCELEGPPLFLATSSRDHSVPGGRRLDLLTQPEKWMAARLAQLKQTHLVGDALPTIRVDYGPVCLGMLMGAPVEFVSDSTWTHSFIREDWSNAPDWKIHADNPWWQLLPRLLRLNAENARGRYIAMTPSLGGTADVLLNTRGADQLCMDLVDQPEKIETAVEKIYGTWREAYQILWGILMGTGVGTINWVGIVVRPALPCAGMRFQLPDRPDPFPPVFPAGNHPPGIRRRAQHLPPGWAWRRPPYPVPAGYA